MFLFPLGLAAKTRRFPVACVTILVGTVVYSVLQFPKNHESTKQMLNAPATQELYRARAALMLAACDETDLDPGICEHLKSTLPTDKPQHPLKLARALETSLKKKFGRELERKDAATVISLVFDDTHWSKKSERFRAYPEYAKYLAARQAFETRQADAQKKTRTLSRANLSWKSLLEAQTTHAGWMHLFGNMLFFLILGIPVEERLGSAVFGLCYLIGGMAGLSFQVAMFDSPVQGLLGASANVSAIAGLFLALFWSNRMRVWTSAFFVWNRVLQVPSWIFIPLFVVMNDITGTIEGGSNVAHLAHLGGFAVGLAVGLAWARIAHLPSGYVFPFEIELMTEARRLDGDRRLAKLAALLYYHPENKDAQDLSLATMVAEGPGSWRTGMKPSRAQKFLQTYFATIFNRKLQETKPGSPGFLAFVGELPADWPLHEITSEVDVGRLREAALTAESTDAASAVRLLKVLGSATASAQERKAIQERIEILQRRAFDASAS